MYIKKLPISNTLFIAPKLVSLAARPASMKNVPAPKHIHSTSSEEAINRPNPLYFPKNLSKAEYGSSRWKRDVRSIQIKK